MTGADFEQAIYRAATDAALSVTAYTGAEAERYAMGIIDGARFSGAMIETPEMAINLVVRATNGACNRKWSVGQ